MKAFKWIVTGAILCVSSMLLAAESDSVIVSHFEPLQKLTLQAKKSANNLKLGAAGPVSLRFDALGRSFDLQLESNAGLLSAETRSALPDGLAIYRGQLTGNTDSRARIVVYEGMPRGLVWDGKQMFAIEAPGDSVVQTNVPIIYRLADAFIQPGTMSCGTKSLSGNAAAVYGKLVGELSTALAQGPGAVSEISVSTIGDLSFTTDRGGDAAAAAAILTRLSNVDLIYSLDIGVQINAPPPETHSSAATDPFTGEREAFLLLQEVGNYRGMTAAHNVHALTHLFTGRDLIGSTVGIAFSTDTGVLCQSTGGAGLSEGNGGPTFDALVAAHEIGHNFGAHHDGDIGEACEAEPLNFIMAPFVDLNNIRFSACSIGIMQANAAAVPSCVTALPTVDMSIALSGQLTALVQGNNATLTYNLNNNGTSMATNVMVDITLPNNVSFVSAATSLGTCSDGAGIVTCDLGDVGGSSLNTITVSTLTTAVGAGVFDATVTADFDERAGNNQEIVPLIVDPAVDLAVNTPIAAAINLDQSTTVRATMDNRSTLDATGVTLSISLNSGLRANTASWSIGNCIVTDQQIDCAATNFASGSNSTLDIGVTGTSAGALSYSVTLASVEADAVMANNSANGMVTVTDPNAKSSGGAMGVPFLCLLGWLVFLMRRRAVGI